MRRLSLVLFCAVVLLRPALAAAETQDRGIVVRVFSGRIAIRELDGTRAAFIISRATTITLDGRRVRVRRLRRGDVAIVDHVGRLATLIQATRP